ncbi:MAG: RlmE family RNA methyltransferase [Alphaproteobacteria bacterium]
MTGSSRTPRGFRRLKVRPTGRHRRPSSARWLERQLNDPYVAAAEDAGLRSRAAFKLVELDDRFHLLGRGRRVVDLGAAPGGWTQVAAARVKALEPAGGKVVAVDVVPMEPVPGATILNHDILAEDAPLAVLEVLEGPADLVLSDMAPPAIGHRAIDHLRIIALAEAAFALAERTLKPGGAFVTKILMGRDEAAFVALLRRRFATVRYAKPAASRKDSAESYVVATGFRGPRAAAGKESERAGDRAWRGTDFV